MACLVQQAVLDRDTLIIIELLRANVLLVDDGVDSSASSVSEGAPRSHTVVEVLHTHQSGLLACFINELVRRKEVEDLRHSSKLPDPEMM